LDYHYLSQDEIAGAKRISRHLSASESIPILLFSSTGLHQREFFDRIDHQELHMKTLATGLALVLGFVFLVREPNGQNQRESCTVVKEALLDSLKI
jgi:hypothetical protein